METILKCNNISKYYGNFKALDGLSFTVSQGMVFGILGPNGSGKTTTLSVILDLFEPSSGDYSWFQSSNKLQTIRKKIGSIIETPNFYPYLNAVTNLKIVADIKEVSYQDINRVLDLVKLNDKKYFKFKNFSLGMKQRLAIASALLGSPKVLILDEPTNGLDPMGIVEIRELIFNCKNNGITVIIASHILTEIEKVCSDIIIINKGKSLIQGNLNELTQQVNLEQLFINQTNQ